MASRLVDSGERECEEATEERRRGPKACKDIQRRVEIQSARERQK